MRDDSIALQNVFLALSALTNLVIYGTINSFIKCFSPGFTRSQSVLATEKRTQIRNGKMGKLNWAVRVAES